MLSILTLNVQAAAIARAQRLLAWLDGRHDSVTILTETSNGPGTAHLLTHCRAAGLAVVHTASADGDRGCAIVSRSRLTPWPGLLPAVTLPGRAVAVTLDTTPAVTVLGIYVPSSDRAPDKVAKKRAFLTSVLDGLGRLTDQQRAHLIVCGDYNVISRDHQPPYPAFMPFEYDFLDALAALGFTDAHQHLHPDVQAYSWIGRGGNGYRFDYVHTGADLTPQLKTCTYLQHPREDRLTDHAAVTATLHIDIGSPLTTTSRLVDTETLF